MIPGEKKVKITSSAKENSLPSTRKVAHLQFHRHAGLEGLHSPETAQRMFIFLYLIKCYN